MKIAIDGLPLTVQRTGVGHYTFEVARGVAEAQPGEQFELVSHSPFISVIDGQRPGNLSLLQQPVNALSKNWWTIGLPLYIRRNAIALFHGTNYDVPLWAGCPTVLTIHDLSLFLHPETHEPRRVNRARRRLPTMARIASQIIVPTHSVKRDVCAHLPARSEKVRVIPEAARKSFHPVNSVTAQPTLDRLGIEKSFILYVGAIEPRKDIVTLVKAFEDLYKNTDLRPQLVIAGPTEWLADDLESYIKRSSVKERILFTGYVDDNELCALYSTCTLMCYPAIYEGAGLPPIEAMACGASVITTKTGAISEMVGDAARLFPPTDYQTLANHIIELFMDCKEREALARRGLKRAADFSWERTAALTYETYLDALRLHKQ
jgi:glycosyltransferase involved in cell wall biosynthesis